MNFGPWVIKKDLISSLQRKAFAVEFTEDKNTAYLLLDEELNDDDYSWKNLYKYENTKNSYSKFWNVQVDS